MGLKGVIYSDFITTAELRYSTWSVSGSVSVNLDWKIGLSPEKTVKAFLFCFVFRESIFLRRSLSAWSPNALKKIKFGYDDSDYMFLHIWFKVNAKAKINIVWGRGFLWAHLIISDVFV